ncbi:serine protease [Streptomyces sp. JJ36]|nr:serine protease [Streptomyces sp. JJ36]
MLAALAGLLAAALAWAPTAAAAPHPAAADRAAPAPAAGPAPVSGERGPDAVSPVLAPGDPIYSGGARCTLGFNVTDGDDVFLLTAGHCTAAGGYWYADPAETVPVGPAVLSSFPGNDYGLVRYADPGLASRGGYTAASPYVGERVHTVTPWTGVRSGTVTGLNVTVSYGGGVVYGLIRTSICVGGPVSGAPLFGSDGRALGIGVGGSSSCATGGTTFFQPLPEALAATGLSLY